jgi:nitronate monooxygenase
LFIGLKWIFWCKKYRASLALAFFVEMEFDVKNNPICQMLGIPYPIIMAPMFLVSNEKMLLEAAKAGIAPVIPALNYRSTQMFREGLKRLNQNLSSAFGVNIIVNKSNVYYQEQLKICCEEHVPFIITSLGSPAEVIKQAHLHGIKVFCDVTDLTFAQKVQQLGADALIAVNSRAGGHAGNLLAEELIPLLKQHCKIPIISAGGVGDSQSLSAVLRLGADACSVGSIFIASEEADVSVDYKNAVVEYGQNDIVMTTKLSGTPCAVINTPYVQKIGTKQNFIEYLLNKNKKIKKWVKAFTFYKGMKALNKAAFGSTYKTIWCAGPSIEYVKKIRPISLIVKELCGELRGKEGL